MDAIKFLESYSKKADSYSKRFFSEKKRTGAKIDKLVVDSLDIFENYSSGGKKLRGALTVLGYQIAGGSSVNKILPVSLGIELLHNFLLIHDDVIDNDDTRRGKPTVHRLFSKKGNEHFGKSKAIVIGDIGAFLGYELITNVDFPKKRTGKAISTLNDLLLKTMYGEMLDVEFDRKSKVSWNDILKVRTYKTAYYTFVMPLSVGAILGGGRKSMLDSIEQYAVPVGIAFQLADDILGVFGDPKRTGKSNESDIKDGKKTFLYARSLDQSGKLDREYLTKWYGEKSLTEGRIKQIRTIMEKAGEPRYSREVAKELVEKGKGFIPKITKKTRFQSTLSSLADFVINRNR